MAAHSGDKKFRVPPRQVDDGHRTPVELDEKKLRALETILNHENIDSALALLDGLARHHDDLVERATMSTYRLISEDRRDREAASVAPKHPLRAAPLGAVVVTGGLLLAVFIGLALWVYSLNGQLDQTKSKVQNLQTRVQEMSHNQGTLEDRLRALDAERSKP